MSARTRHRRGTEEPEVPADSPLEVVHEAERAFAARVGRARVAADAKVASARREAARILAASHEEARWDAERAAEDELARTRREVERIEAETEKQVAAIRRSAKRYLDDAAEAIVAFVLPTPGRSGDEGGPPC